MSDEYLNFPDLNKEEFDCYLQNPEEYLLRLDTIPPGEFPANPPEIVPPGEFPANPPEITDPGELVPQTGSSIDTKNFAGNYNFRVDIEDTTSKFYSYSDKLKRLYCNMDKGVPIKLFWEGPPMLHVRAVLAFDLADDISKPVVRCKSHNDPTIQNNIDCEHREHVIRCDNENSVYKNNSLSLRHSVVTSINNNPDSDGVRVVYRFMCSNTCSGPGAIARRNTNLILTLEDNGVVVGRVVIGVKICSCPCRDKRKAEEDDGGKKKRKSQEAFVVVDSRRVKKENCTVTSERQELVTGPAIKQEVLTDGTGEYVDLQVSVPNFPARHVGDLSSVMRRIVASYFASDEDIAAVTQNVQIHQV